MNGIRNECCFLLQGYCLLDQQGQDGLTYQKDGDHLIEVAYYADKKNEKLHDARKEIYAALSEEQDSSMARNIFNHANLASNELKRDLASDD